MADRGAEERFSVALFHCQQRDFQIESQEFLNDYAGRCAASARHGRVPGGLQLFRSVHNALTLPRGAHHRFHHHWPAEIRCNLVQFLGTCGVSEPRRPKRQLLSGQISDSIPVHGHGGRPGRWDHGDAFLLELCQSRYSKGFDLGDHHVGTVAACHLQQGGGIGHRQHLHLVGNLHGGSAGVAVAGDDAATEPLCGDSDFLAKLTTAQQHHSARKTGHASRRMMVVTIIDQHNSRPLLKGLSPMSSGR